LAGNIIMTIFEDIVEVVNALPIDEFVKDDGAGAYYVDAEASDYKDHARDFKRAMLTAAVLRDRLALIDFDPDEPAEVQAEKMLEKGLTL